MKNKNHQHQGSMEKKSSTNLPEPKHIPVLLDEVLQYLAPQEGESYLDLTAGYGGHAGAVLERTLPTKKTVLVDRDDYAVRTLQAKFGRQVEILKSDFYSASKLLTDSGRKFDIILADLGISSVHIDDGERGFSFEKQGPLDMRMDSSQELTAYEVVNKYDQADLSRLIRQYGDERHANAIAKAIIRERPVESTRELADIIKSTYPKWSKIHPATRTFQALRIAVNDEIGQLEQSLPLWLDLLEPGGRLGVISFHSLEDKLVKTVFREVAGGGYDQQFHLLAKKPIVPGDSEIAFNPRARSAKFRAVVKIKK